MSLEILTGVEASNRSQSTTSDEATNIATYFAKVPKLPCVAIFRNDKLSSYLAAAYYVDYTFPCILAALPFPSL